MLDLSIEGFLGVKIAPGAHASLQAHLAIDLHLLDPQAPGATDQAELLKVSFASLGQVSIACWYVKQQTPRRGCCV
ncbi:hypothetical protein M5G13_19040 [Pseudomonas sp. TNT2022 ID609]|uniref:hypothetical protein n=1 Tax=Pseudomonas rubra TaxID=2942627 RepID=UPI0023619EAB|nr:hypothetical protein [Pseudomonas rubra]MDD1040214.1 hypothetical protein [Pseudomonas rubra]